MLSVTSEYLTALSKSTAVPYEHSRPAFPGGFKSRTLLKNISERNKCFCGFGVDFGRAFAQLCIAFNALDRLCQGSADVSRLDWKAF